MIDGVVGSAAGVAVEPDDSIEVIAGVAILVVMSGPRDEVDNGNFDVDAACVEIGSAVDVERATDVGYDV